MSRKKSKVKPRNSAVYKPSAKRASQKQSSQKKLHTKKRKKLADILLYLPIPGSLVMLATDPILALVNLVILLGVYFIGIRPALIKGQMSVYKNKSSFATEYNVYKDPSGYWKTMLFIIAMYLIFSIAGLIMPWLPQPTTHSKAQTTDHDSQSLMKCHTVS